MSERLSLNPHVFATRANGATALVKVEPYIRLANSTGEEVYLQKGKFFEAGGPEIPKNKVPKWVLDALPTLNPKALAEAGHGHKVED